MAKFKETIGKTYRNTESQVRQQLSRELGVFGRASGNRGVGLKGRLSEGFKMAGANLLGLPYNPRRGGSDQSPEQVFRAMKLGSTSTSGLVGATFQEIKPIRKMKSYSDPFLKQTRVTLIGNEFNRSLRKLGNTELRKPQNKILKAVTEGLGAEFRTIDSELKRTKQSIVGLNRHIVSENNRMFNDFRKSLNMSLKRRFESLDRQQRLKDARLNAALENLQMGAGAGAGGLGRRGGSTGGGSGILRDAGLVGGGVAGGFLASWLAKNGWKILSNTFKFGKFASFPALITAIMANETGLKRLKNEFGNARNENEKEQALRDLEREANLVTRSNRNQINEVYDANIEKAKEKGSKIQIANVLASKLKAKTYTNTTTEKRNAALQEFLSEFDALGLNEQQRKQIITQNKLGKWAYDKLTIGETNAEKRRRREQRKNRGQQSSISGPGGVVGPKGPRPSTQISRTGSRRGQPSFETLYNIQKTNEQKAEFLKYGKLPTGFEFLPGHMGRLGSAGAVSARGAMPLGGGYSGGGGYFGGGGYSGGYSGGGVQSSLSRTRQSTPQMPLGLPPNVGAPTAQDPGLGGLSGGINPQASNYDQGKSIERIGSLANVKRRESMQTDRRFSLSNDRYRSPFNWALSAEAAKEFGLRNQSKAEVTRNLVEVVAPNGKKVMMNKSVAADATEFLRELSERGYKIKTLGGFSYRRNVNNPSRLSIHAIGGTMDINASWNRNQSSMTDMPDEIKDMAMLYGFAQLGNDKMHFERVSPAARRKYILDLMRREIIGKDHPQVQKLIQQKILKSDDVKQFKNFATSASTSTATAAGPAGTVGAKGPRSSSATNMGTNRVMIGGATTPKNISQDAMKALNEVAKANNIDPAALSMMIDTESKWKTSTRSPSGTYRGLTQMGRQTFREAGGRLNGLTWNEYLNASPADQIRTYGAWLNHYKFKDKLKRNNVNLSNLPPNVQAAYLQGFQFAPNAESWQREFGKGNFDVRTTRSKQARVLGSTSINDMSRYYGGKTQRSPPIYQPGTNQEPNIPTSSVSSDPRLQALRELEKIRGGQQQAQQPAAQTSSTPSPMGRFQTRSIERRAAKMEDPALAVLTRFREASPNFEISSTYRSPKHPIEARKRTPGTHSKGIAFDISTRNKTSEELQIAVQNLIKSGVNYILLEGNPPHIHAEVRENLNNPIIRNLGNGHPTISLRDAIKAARSVKLNEFATKKQSAAQAREQERKTTARRTTSSLPGQFESAMESVKSGSISPIPTQKQMETGITSAKPDLSQLNAMDKLDRAAAMAGTDYTPPKPPEAIAEIKSKPVKVPSTEYQVSDLERRFLGIPTDLRPPPGIGPAPDLSKFQTEQAMNLELKSEQQKSSRSSAFAAPGITPGTSVPQETMPPMSVRVQPPPDFTGGLPSPGSTEALAAPYIAAEQERERVNAEREALDPDRDLIRAEAAKAKAGEGGAETPTPPGEGGAAAAGADGTPSFGNHPESSGAAPGTDGRGSFGRCFV